MNIILQADEEIIKGDSIMRSRYLFIKAIAVLFAVFLLPMHFPFADNNAYTSGTTQNSTSVQIYAYSSDAFIVLASSTGLASVKQNNNFGFFQQYGEEKHYGFMK